MASAATKKVENTVKESVYKISREVKALLNIGDDGKVDSFIGKIEKKANRNISQLKQNIKAIEFKKNSKEEKLKEDLEDAKIELYESYRAIEIDKIKTNQDQNNYISEYLSNIAEKKDKVSAIEKQMEDLEEQTQAQIDDLNEQIKAEEEVVKEVTQKA